MPACCSIVLLSLSCRLACLQPADAVLINLLLVSLAHSSASELIQAVHNSCVGPAKRLHMYRKCHCLDHRNLSDEPASAALAVVCRCSHLMWTAGCATARMRCASGATSWRAPPKPCKEGSLARTVCTLPVLSPEPTCAAMRRPLRLSINAQLVDCIATTHIRAAHEHLFPVSKHQEYMSYTRMKLIHNVTLQASHTLLPW